MWLERFKVRKLSLLAAVKDPEKVLGSWIYLFVGSCELCEGMGHPL